VSELSVVLATAIPASSARRWKSSPVSCSHRRRTSRSPGALDVVEDDRSARRETVDPDGQCRVAGQPMPGGVRRRPVHEERIDEIAPQRRVESRRHRSVVVPRYARLGEDMREERRVDDHDVVSDALGSAAR
jgi:hypothetical protein